MGSERQQQVPKNLSSCQREFFPSRPRQDWTRTGRMGGGGIALCARTVRGCADQAKSAGCLVIPKGMTSQGENVANVRWNQPTFSFGNCAAQPGRFSQGKGNKNGQEFQLRKFLADVSIRGLCSPDTLPGALAAILYQNLESVASNFHSVSALGLEPISTSCTCTW